MAETTLAEAMVRYCGYTMEQAERSVQLWNAWKESIEVLSVKPGWMAYAKIGADAVRRG